MNNKKEIISYVGEREIEFCVRFINIEYKILQKDGLC